MEWAHLPLGMRVGIFNRRFNITITKETLGNWYKKLNIRWLKPQYRTFRLQNQEEKLMEQQAFVYQLMTHIMAGGLYGFYDQSTYHGWMKTTKIWRYPDGYDNSKQFSLLLPRSRGTSITVHALLLSDGRLLHSIAHERTTTDSICHFLESKLRNVDGALIVHDKLRAN